MPAQDRLASEGVAAGIRLCTIGWSATGLRGIRRELIVMSKGLDRIHADVSLALICFLPASCNKTSSPVHPFSPILFSRFRRLSSSSDHPVIVSSPGHHPVSSLSSYFSFLVAVSTMTNVIVFHVLSKFTNTKTVPHIKYHLSPLCFQPFTGLYSRFFASVSIAIGLACD
jgi:hypothetical protein